MRVLAAMCFSLLGTSLFGVPIFVEARDSTRRASPPGKRTVVPGTWCWKVPENVLGNQAEADLWWEIQTHTRRRLTPLHGAGLILLEGRDYTSIDRSFLAQLQYSPQSIDGSDNDSSLKPGTVLALKTSKGDYVKLRVLRYYSLRNLDFESAKVISPRWKENIPNWPDTPTYHIEFEWQAYPVRR